MAPGIPCYEYLQFCVVFSCVSLIDAQTYGNATYNRLPVVSQFHTEDFDVNIDNILNSYMEEIINIPYKCACIFFAAILIFEIALCCRWCCDCCRCVNAYDSTLETISQFMTWAASVKKSRNRLSYCYFVSIALNLLILYGFLACRYFMLEGNDVLVSSVNELYELTIDLENSGDDLIYLGDVVINTTELASQTCPEASVILNNTDFYLDSLAEYNEIIDPIPGNLHDLRNFSEEGGENIAGGMYSLLSVFFILCVFNLSSYLLRKRTMMRVSLGVELVVIHVTLAAWVGGCVMLLILSDFCIAPTDNAILITPSGMKDIAYYYGTCNGTNPLYSPLAETAEAVAYLNGFVNNVTAPGGACEGNEYLLSMYPYIEEMQGNLSYIEKATDCPPVQEEWAKIFNDVFCDDYFIAIYVLFMTNSALCVCLYGLMVSSSLISQYFDDYWETGNLVEGGVDGANLLDVDTLERKQLQPDGSVSMSSASLPTGAGTAAGNMFYSNQFAPSQPPAPNPTIAQLQSPSAKGLEPLYSTKVYLNPPTEGDSSEDERENMHNEI